MWGGLERGRVDVVSQGMDVGWKSPIYTTSQLLFLDKSPNDKTGASYEQNSDIPKLHCALE